MESGETLEEAAIRELHEETGLILSHPRPNFATMADKDFYCTTFVGKIFGEIQTEESGRVAWVTWKELIEGPFGLYNQILFNSLIWN